MLTEASTNEKVFENQRFSQFPSPVSTAVMLFLPAIGGNVLLLSCHFQVVMMCIT